MAHKKTVFQPIPLIRQLTHHAWERVDPNSLRFRLTMGVSLVALLGIGGMSGWMSWRTQQILMGSHKQLVADVSERAPQDVAAYADLMPLEQAVDKAIEVRTLPHVFILVTSPTGQVLGQSDQPWHQEGLAATLIAMPTLARIPQIFEVGEQDYVICRRPLLVDGDSLGTLYVALDVTADRVMFSEMLVSLALGTAIAIAVIVLGIAIYVGRSLIPLRQMSQMTEHLSVNDLGRARLQLANAPTEVEELVRTCESTLARLADALDQQRQFTHDISHELRTPLTIVYGYLSSTLRRCTTLTDPQREALEVAAAEAEQTIRILEDLLDLARADSGSLQLNLEPVLLEPLVQDLAEMAAQSSNHPVEVAARQPDIVVQADTGALKRVLANLIDNALKYSDADQPVVVTLDQQEGNGIIQVCDRGVGIPLQHQSRIFDRCYRVDEARSRATGGCGLGLALVRALVEGMGGTITVRSKPQEGSVFTITLPLFSDRHDSAHRSRRRRRKASPIH
ncbi:MAG: HAMP domain-containing sensor histidine kinase [Synechococcales bacterium]|nr:HAMP domain-containing sensor histidine kinase [Synechococcales bacterium]